MANNEYPTLSALETMVLNILISLGTGSESYGLELLDKSNGMLKKGSIYVTLGRMEEKGYLESRKEELRPGARGLPRRLYKVSGHGQKVLQYWQTAFGGLQGILV
jgi:DNA-binding PadR family transcriptional regulator